MNPKLRLALLIVAGITLTWSAYSMYKLPLWGYRPLWLYASFWAIFNLLVIYPYAKKKSQLRFFNLSLISGALLYAGFPNSPLTFLLFVGFVPLLMIENEIGKKQKFALWLYAYNAFVIWNIFTTFWVANTSFGPSIVAIFLNSFLMCIPFLLFYIVAPFAKSNLKYLCFIAFWICFEYIHLGWDISWPWLNLGNGLAQYPSFIQWYEYLGAFGGTLWILLLNVLAYKYWSERSKGNLLQLILTCIVPMLISLFILWSYEDKGTKEVEVVVVQPNFEPHYDKFTVPDHLQAERFIRLSRSALTQNSSYLVFPETSFGVYDADKLKSNTTIKKMLSLLNEYPKTKLLTGLSTYRYLDESYKDLPTIRIDDNRGKKIYYDAHNSAFQMAANDSISEIYLKSKLVPGAELFPFRDYLPFIKPLVKKLGGSVAGLTGQEERSVFVSEDGNVAPVICYESIYGEYVSGYSKNGASMIFIITNDGWWDDTPGHIQHMKFASMRAIEQRKPIARSANTGISCFIDERGFIHHKTKYNEAVAITANIKPNKHRTFYSVWGDIIARIAIFTSLILLLTGMVQFFKER